MYRRFHKIVELEDEQFVHYGFCEKGKIISRIFQVIKLLIAKGRD
jgi:hypothetical protein